MEHYLRPHETMSHYLPPNLANEVVAPVDTRKMKERHEHNQRAATLVKDDDLWKELQQELAKSKCITQAGIREITKEFMKKRQGQLDAQTLKDQAEAKSQPKNRRSSNQADYSRRSSLSIITEKGQNIRRALSLGNGDQQQPPSNNHRSKGKRRDSKIGNFMNNSLSKMNSSMSKLSIEGRPNKFFTGGPRSQSDGDVQYTLEPSTNVYDGLPDLNASLSSSNSSSNRSSLEVSTGALDTHVECGTDDELSRDGMSGDEFSCGSDDDLDGELLVLFPTRPRRRTKTQSQQNIDMARTA